MWVEKALWPILYSLNACTLRSWHWFNNLADVDECSSNPCQEGAICINSWGSFVCLSQDRDECLHSPCPDGATCINTPESFLCLVSRML